MQYGYFTMPSHPPERPLYDGHAGTCRRCAGPTSSAFPKAGSASTTPHRGSRTPRPIC